MKSLVVLFAVIAAAVAAPQLLVQPPNTPAIVLDAVGRPLDTAEVASARALHYQAKVLEGHILKKRSVGHAVAYSVPAAVSHQSRVDVRTSPAIVASTVGVAPVVAEPVVEARAVFAAPAVVAAPAAVSHQSRVDVRTSPAVVASAPVVAAAPTVVEARAVNAVPAASLYSAPVYSAPSAAVYAAPAATVYSASAPAVYAAPAAAVYAAPSAAVYAAPAATVYAGGSAVSHQSRVDVQSSPAVVAEQVLAPAVVEARSAWAPSVYASSW